MVGSHENVPLGIVIDIFNIDLHARLKAHFEQLRGSGTKLACPLRDFNALNKWDNMTIRRLLCVKIPNAFLLFEAHYLIYSEHSNGSDL